MMCCREAMGETGTGGTGSGTGTGPAVDPWRQHCENGGGTWNGRWCAYSGEVKGDCWVDNGIAYPDSPEGETR